MQTNSGKDSVVELREESNKEADKPGQQIKFLQFKIKIKSALAQSISTNKVIIFLFEVLYKASTLNIRWKIVPRVHNPTAEKVLPHIKTGLWFNPLVPMRGIFGIFECPFDMLSGIAQNEKRSWSR